MTKSLHQQAVDAAKNRVQHLVKERGGHLSFAELNRLEPASKGDFQFALNGYENILMWHSLSEEYAEAISELLREKSLHPHPATELTYLADGLFPKLPIARSLQQFKAPHWFPMTLHTEPLEA